MFTQFILNKAQFGFWTALMLLLMRKGDRFSYDSDKAAAEVMNNYIYYGANVVRFGSLRARARHAFRRNGRLFKAYNKMAAYQHAHLVASQAHVLGRTAVVIAIPHWTHALLSPAPTFPASDLTYSIWTIHTDASRAGFEGMQDRCDELSENINRIFAEPDKLAGVIQLVGQTSLSFTLNNARDNLVDTDNEALIKAFNERTGVLAYLGTVKL